MRMNLTELVVAFNPQSIQARYRGALVALGFRLVIALVSFGLTYYVYVTFAQTWSPWMVLLLFLSWGLPSLFWLILSGISVVSAIRARRLIHAGPAVTLSSWGIGLNGRRFGWDEVSRVWAAPGYGGAGPRLVVQTFSGEWEEISFSLLDTMPGTFDAALRAYGRSGLDLRPLDDLL